MSQPTHVQPTDLGEADRALKPKHRGMWASGNYHAVVTDIISELGPILVSAAGIRPGDLVLDVAAGSGNSAIPAAQAGAQVIASDLTPRTSPLPKRSVTISSSTTGPPFRHIKPSPMIPSA